MWGSVMPECPTFAVKLGKLGKCAKWAKCALGTLKGSTGFGAEALGREPAKRLHGSGAGWRCRRRRGDCDHFNDTCDGVNNAPLGRIERGGELDAAYFRYRSPWPT